MVHIVHERAAIRQNICCMGNEISRRLQFATDVIMEMKEKTSRHLSLNVIIPNTALLYPRQPASAIRTYRLPSGLQYHGFEIQIEELPP